MDFLFHTVNGCHSVCFGGTVNAETDDLFAVIECIAGVGTCSKFHFCYVFQIDHRTVVVATDDDIFKFGFFNETSLNVQLVADVLVTLFGTDRSGSRLNVLRSNRRLNVRNGDSKPGHAQRVKPDTHGVFLQRHHFAGCNTVDTGYCIFNICFDIVVQRHHIGGGTIGKEDEHCKNIAAALVHVHPEFGHIGGKFRVCAVHSVLQVHQCHIGIGSAFEGDVTAVRTGVAGVGGEVEQVFHTVDLVFDGHSNRLCHHFRTCSGVFC